MRECVDCGETMDETAETCVKCGSRPAGPVRATQLVGGVVLPFICFAISLPSGPEWQSGQQRAYAQLLLSHGASAPLYPFLLYSMVSMVLLFAQPVRFGGNIWVRFGVFSGVVIATEYWVVFMIGCAGTDVESLSWLLACSALVVFVPWGLWWLLGFLMPRYRTALAAAFFALGAIGSPWLLFLCLMCSTPWALASYVFVSVRLFRSSGSRWRITLAQLLGSVTWFAAHCGAWRLSFLVMLEKYSRLPTSPPPQCFIATAAAKGHPRVVRSEICRLFDGAAFPVTRQLRVLKALELLLASISPSTHRACRWVYDRVGPKLAAMLVHPLLADVAYFLLKPLEWLGLACLSLAIPGKLGLIGRLYPGRSAGEEALRQGPGVLLHGSGDAAASSP